jgi:hypothetical protein
MTNHHTEARRPTVSELETAVLVACEAYWKNMRSGWDEDDDEETFHDAMGRLTGVIEQRRKVQL